MSDSSNISPVIQPLFAEMRDQLNTRYRQRTAMGARIDIGSWLRHVARCIAPTVERVHASSPDRSKETLYALYDVGLDLCALGHFSETGRSIRLEELWCNTFPRLAPILAQSPRMLVGSLSNAVLYLNQWSDTQAARWLAALSNLGPYCENPTQLLNSGQFLAWTSGLAHLRLAAIQIASQLPLRILHATLGITESTSESETRGYLAKLAVDPWASPTPKYGIFEVAQCGNFRGLSGLFARPPQAFLFEDAIHVTDGNRNWRLYADRFGHAFHPFDGVPAKPMSKNPRSFPSITSDGVIRWGNTQIERPDLGGTSSRCFDGKTMAVTIPTSYHVYLFSRYE